MKKKFKYMLTVVGEHFLYILVTLAVISIAGAAFGDAFWIVSIITSLIYLSSMYSSGWNASGRDLRSANARFKNGEGDFLDYRIYDGFIYAVPLAVISLGMFIFHIVAKDFAYTQLIYRVYYFSFLWLFDKFKGADIVVDLVVALLPGICYGVGYVVGKSKKTFVIQHIGKLVYKQKSKKNKQ